MAEATQILSDVKASLEEYHGKAENRVKELLAEGKKESDAEVTAVKAEIEKLTNSLDSVQKQIKNIGDSVTPGLAEDNVGEKFSFTSFVQALARMRKEHIPEERAFETSDAKFELDVIRSHEQHLREKGLLNKTQNAGDGSSGGYLIPQEVSADIIGLVKAKTPLLDKLPVKMVEGITGEFVIPKLTGRHTGYWVGENSEPTESSATFGQIIANPKKVGAYTRQSNRLIYQSRGVSDRVIKDELAKAMALKLHEGLLKGTGSEYQPKGLTRYSSDFTAATKIDTALGTDGGRFTITLAKLMESLLAAADETNEDPTKMGFLMRPEVKYGMVTERVPQYTGQGSNKGMPVVVGQPILTDEQLKMYVGQYATTTQLANNLTAGSGTTLSNVIFGNWDYFWAMFWRDMIIKVSDVATDGSGNSAFLQDMMMIVAFQEVNCAVTRPAAFTMATRAETDSSAW